MSRHRPMARRLRHEPLEDRTLLSGVPYQQWLYQTTTGLHECGDDFAFDMVDWDGGGTLDLVAIKKWGTGTGRTEVHVFSGESQFQTAVFQTGTGLGETNQNWEFAIGGFGDLVALNKADTSGYVQMLVLTRSSDYQSMWVPNGDGRTGLYVRGGDWDLEFADVDGDGQDDLVGIRKDAPWDNTQVQVYSGASLWRTRILLKNTPLGETGADWDFEVGRHTDIASIQRYNTASGRTELRMLAHQTAYQTFHGPPLDRVVTCMGNTQGNFEFEFVDFNGDGYDDLIAIMKSGTSSHTTELHMVSGEPKYPPVIIRNFYGYNGSSWTRIFGNDKTWLDNEMPTKFKLSWGSYSEDGLSHVQVNAKLDSSTFYAGLFFPGGPEPWREIWEDLVIDPTARSLGEYTLSVTATSALGVSGTETLSFTLKDDDSTAPSVSFSNVVDQDDGAVDMGVTISDPSGIGGYLVQLCRADNDQVVADLDERSDAWLSTEEDVDVGSDLRRELRNGSADIETPYYLKVTAHDDDEDRPDDSATRTVKSATFTIHDDDTDGPVITLGGSEGTETQSQDQLFWWIIEDDSDLYVLDVSITHDDGDGPKELIEFTHPDFFAIYDYDIDTYCDKPGRYEITVSATDADGDRPGDRTTSATFHRTVVVAPDGERIYWWNRGGALDGFAHVFGAGAEAARNVVDAALGFWERAITDFQYDVGPDVYVVDVRAEQASELGGTSWVTRVGEDGRPREGAFALKGISSIPDTAGWFVDPTPEDWSEFDAHAGYAGGPSFNAFVGFADPAGPAAGLVDLFSTASHEMLHLLGLTLASSSLPELRLQSDPDGYLIPTGVNDHPWYASADWPGKLWVFDGPSVTALLTSNNGASGGIDFGRPVHVALPQQAGAVGGAFGALEMLNAAGFSGLRKLPSNLDALILNDAYGYQVTLPETFGTMYSILNESTGELLVRGGFGASDDQISIARVADRFEVRVDVGDDVPGTGPTDAFVSTFATADVASIRILGYDGSDTVMLGSDLGIAVDVDGGYGLLSETDRLFVEGTTTEDSLVVTSAAVVLNGVAVSYVDIDELAVDGLEGGDVYALDLSAAGPGIVTIADSGSAGTDALTVNGTALGDTISVTATQVILGSPAQQAVVYTGIEDLGVDGGTGHDTITVDGAQGTVLGGTGQDAIEVLCCGLEGLFVDGQEDSDSYTVNFGSLAGTVTASDSGLSGAEDLTVNGTPGDDWIVMTPSQVTLGDPPVETIDYSGMEDVTIDEGAGNDTIIIDGSQTTILGGAGKDVFVVNANGPHGLLLDGQDGSDVYTVNLGSLDGAVTVADTGPDADTDQVAVNGTAGDDAMMLTEGELTSGDQTVFFTTVEDLSIDGGGGNDTVDVEGSLTTPALWENSTGAGITAGVLLVVGTEASDDVAVDRDGDDTVVVSADFIPDPDQDNFKRFDASEISQIRVIVLGGDDRVSVAGSIAISAMLDGGPGADRLKGGAGHDVLLGGAGDDLLLGKSGRDLLIGGYGADRIVGNADDDILIGGFTTHDTDPAALDAIIDEWTRPDTEATCQERIDHLSGIGTGLNGSVLLDGTTVSRDGAVDVLTGSAGLDWFWFDEAEDHDRATDLKDEAFVDDLDWIEA